MYVYIINIETQNILETGSNRAEFPITPPNIIILFVNGSIPPNQHHFTIF